MPTVDIFMLYIRIIALSCLRFCHSGLWVDLWCRLPVFIVLCIWAHIYNIFRCDEAISFQILFQSPMKMIQTSSSDYEMIQMLVFNFQRTPDGSVKVIERFDCSGCGDVDTSKKVSATADGFITGLSGHKIKVCIDAKVVCAHLHTVPWAIIFLWAIIVCSIIIFF